MPTDHAAEIGRHRDLVAATVKDDAAAVRPRGVGPHGARVTDSASGVRHLIEFLQASVERADPTALCDYARWRRDLVHARGEPVGVLRATFDQVRGEFAALVPASTAEAIDVTMRAAIEALEEQPDRSESGSGRLSASCRLYLAAAIDGRHGAALPVVREALRDGSSLVDVYVDIFQAALFEVGRRWQAGTLTIAEEHLATATTQYILAVLHEEQARAPRHGRTAVVVHIGHDRHVVGASIVAAVLDADGWETRFLAPEVPPESLATAITDAAPHLVAISVTMIEGVAAVRELIARIRGAVVPPRIIVGGGVFIDEPDLWRTLGADGFAPDARTVVEAARG